MNNIQTVGELISLLEAVKAKTGEDTKLSFWEHGVSDEIPTDEEYLTHCISDAILRGDVNIMNSSSQNAENVTLYLRLSI